MYRGFVCSPAGSPTAVKCISLLFSSANQRQGGKHLKGFSSIIEAQWIYNHCQRTSHLQPPPSWWTDREKKLQSEREKEGKKKIGKAESLWELGHVVWVSMSTTVQGNRRSAEHPAVHWNSTLQEWQSNSCTGMWLHLCGCYLTLCGNWSSACSFIQALTSTVQL